MENEVLQKISAFKEAWISLKSWAPPELKQENTTDLLIVISNLFIGYFKLKSKRHEVHGADYPRPDSLYGFYKDFLS